MLTVILGFIIVGLIIGILGRLVAPGRNPIGILGTIVAGLVGAIVGGLIGHAIVPGHPWLALLLEVVVAAVVVSMLTRSRYGSTRHYGRI